MIGKVFQLNDLTARDLMTPRVSAPTLDGSLSLEAQRALLLGNNAPWWVVLGDQVDKVLGVANRERLLTALLENRGLLTPVDLCEPVEYVPEMIRADRLLTGFRRDSGGGGGASRQHEGDEPGPSDTALQHRPLPPAA